VPDFIGKTVIVTEGSTAQTDLVMVWSHFDLTAPDGLSEPEPFSFVVNAGQPHLAQALEDYIAANSGDYGDGSGACPRWSASGPRLPT
jgi:hypothetical protein